MRDLPSHFERFQNILDGLPQMVWANEPGGKEYYNRQWIEFTGTEMESGKPYGRATLIHPDDRDHALSQWKEAQQTGNYEAEYRLRHHSGEYLWIVSRGLPQYDENGKIVAWYGTCTNIHDRKMTREALTVSEALNRSIIGSSADPIVLLGLDATIIFLNDSAKRELSPQRAAGIVGRNWVEEFVPGLKEAQDAFDKALGGETGKFTANYPDPEGRTKWWDTSLTSVVDEDRQVVGISVVSRDITQMKTAEVRLVELQREIIHVSRLSAMGTMAGTLAHELNQPLAAAANYLRAGRRIAESGDPDTSRLEHALEEAERQIQRVGEIIRRVRNMVSQQGLQTESASLKQLVKDALKLFFSIGRGDASSVRTNIAKEADLVRVDAVQAEQVLLNLIRNAWDIMKDCERRELTISARREGKYSVVRVKDIGPGIEPGQENNVFTPMQSPTGKGLGLGLSISRTIVESHGGQIWAENDPDGGASFCFTLPADGDGES
ncbi:MAG: PAS domain S-box protein [Sphingosinicella sp.]|nr:PAS domain S-box protein [Sphingosinicella sp.]